MLSPLETGTALGATPRTWEEPGDRSLARVPGTGGRRAAPAKPGNWPGWSGEAGRGPSISYMGGPCLILSGGKRLLPGSARRQPPECQPRRPGHGRVHRREPHAASPRPRQQTRKVPRPLPRPKPATSTRGPHSSAFSSEPRPEPRVRPVCCVMQALARQSAACTARGCLPAGCAQTCGRPVRNEAELVRKRWKCWGFRCLAAPITGLFPGNTPAEPCAYGENRNCPHVVPQWIINASNVYRMFILL